MTKLSLTNDGTNGTCYIHALSVKDNIIQTVNKFNEVKLPDDAGNMVTRLVPLLMGSRTIEVMGYIHKDIETLSTTRTRLLNFARKNSYTYLYYASFNETITGYIQGLEIREVPTGNSSPDYLLVTFNIIEGERIIE